MGRYSAALALLTVVALLGGCATKPEIPFDRSANNIKMIMQSGTKVSCPPLYNQGGAYITGEKGSYNCTSGPYH